MIDRDHPEFARVFARFAGEEVVWLITVRSDGQPQASPVWATWDDAGILIYSQPEAGKLRNIAANARVALHLDGGVDAHTTAIIEGTAAVSDDPPADEMADYRTKYSGPIEANGWTAAAFAADYSVPIRVTPERLRAW